MTCECTMHASKYCRFGCWRRTADTTRRDFLVRPGRLCSMERKTGGKKKRRPKRFTFILLLVNAYKMNSFSTNKVRFSLLLVPKRVVWMRANVQIAATQTDFTSRLRLSSFSQFLLYFCSYLFIDFLMDSPAVSIKMGNDVDLPFYRLVRRPRNAHRPFDSMAICRRNVMKERLPPFSIETSNRI